MIVSCYADTSVAEGFASHWRPHLKAEATRIRGALASDPRALAEFEQHLETIREVLESPEARHARGMAIFGVSGRKQPLALPSDEPYQNRLVVDEEPYLVPLIEADYRSREHLVVLTDTHRGRLYAATSSEARLIDELEVEASKKNQNHLRAEHILHYEKELVQCVEKAWNAHTYEGIILLGEHEVLEGFRHLLPKRLAELVVHESPHAWAGMQPQIHDVVRGIVDVVIQNQEQRLLAEIDGRLREGFAVASGPQEVIDALRNGQVHELALGADLAEVAYRCSGCRSLFVTVEQACPYCHALCAKVDLLQEILSLAVRHGVAVHFVRSGDGLLVRGGVAALLSRDAPPWVENQSDRSHLAERGA
jgi:peptide subunit release factor 1 (eRF1)